MLICQMQQKTRQSAEYDVLYFANCLIFSIFAAEYGVNKMQI